MLPFTRGQFLDVFGNYNPAVWPAQFIAYVLGAVACVVVARKLKSGSLVVPAVLAAMWLWTGVAYMALAFAPINPVAYAFAIPFCAEALLLGVAGSLGSLAFARPGGIRAVAGWALVAYAMVAYPLVGLLTGETYPRMPMFGITPCPVTLFTFGILLLAIGTPWWLWIVPVAWSLVGGSAAVVLQVPQDWPLLFSGLVAVPLAFRAVRGRGRTAAPS